MSEKEILREALARVGTLDTHVKQYEPAAVRNPLSQERVGRYRSLDDRICVTADMKLIKDCFERRGQDPPSFLEAGPREYLYFDPADVQAAIVTPGGVAPGLNTVIHSVVNMHMHPKLYNGRSVYGFLGGLRGLAQRQFVKLTPEITKAWIHEGGTELGTSRGEKDIPAMVSALQDLNVNILYVVGGDGSLTAAHQLAQELERSKVEIRGKKVVVAGIPKTMDNDVLWVWHTFGFDTAVQEAARAINHIHDDTKATERICLMQLFGRDAGFLAAHASLASGQVDAVLVPEVEYSVEPLLDYIEDVLTEKNYALIVVAEGAVPVEYTDEYIHERLRSEGFDRNDPCYRTHSRVSEALAEGRLTFLKEKFEERFVTGGPDGRRPFRGGRHRVFTSQPRHLIRAVPANASDQIYCQRLADLAVHNALAGFTDFMVSQWLTEYVLIPLELVTGRRGAAAKRLSPEGLFWKTVISSTGQPSFAPSTSCAVAERG